MKVSAICQKSQKAKLCGPFHKPTLSNSMSFSCVCTHSIQRYVFFMYVYVFLIFPDYKVVDKLDNCSYQSLSIIPLLSDPFCEAVEKNCYLKALIHIPSGVVSSISNLTKVLIIKFATKVRKAISPLLDIVA